MSASVKHRNSKHWRTGRLWWLGHFGGSRADSIRVCSEEAIEAERLRRADEARRLPLDGFEQICAAFAERSALLEPLQQLAVAASTAKAAESADELAVSSAGDGQALDLTAVVRLLRLEAAGNKFYGLPAQRYFEAAVRPKLYRLGFEHPPHGWSTELHAECARLESALYSMPEAVGGLPGIFSVHQEVETKPMNLDEDGLEVVVDFEESDRYLDTLPGLP